MGRLPLAGCRHPVGHPGLDERGGPGGVRLHLAAALANPLEHLDVTHGHRGQHAVGVIDIGVGQHRVDQAGPRAGRQMAGLDVQVGVDEAGDVYLVGRLPLHAVTAEEVDRILGSVLQYADESFDRLLEIGFAGSIRREWQWRQKNGMPTANLQAFARFADPDR